ncbi:unnamed protein product [Ranitomeya imitator]|uniref:Uncharacterized protein n=1 Tax=Ranitomeya imitator TaxID=111125 RepID=A0ABN9LRK5_9NEOB|nr:unnamed protein product [Ranitomeya imitator]
MRKLFLCSVVTWYRSLRVQYTVPYGKQDTLLHICDLVSDLPLRMDKDVNEKAKRILYLTLEIITLLTGEDYTVMKKTSDEYVTPSSCPLNELLPNLVHERINDEKILKVTNKIIELLTGEKKDWSEVQMDVHKSVMMKSRLSLSSSDGSSRSSTPESCSSPFYIEDCEKTSNNSSQSDEVTRKHKENEVFVIKVEAQEEDEMYMNGGEWCKEERTTTDSLAVCRFCKPAIKTRSTDAIRITYGGCHAQKTVTHPAYGGAADHYFRDFSAYYGRNIRTVFSYAECDAGLMVCGLDKCKRGVGQK